VVGKLSQPDDVDAALAERVAEALGVANATERCHRLSAKLAERRYFTIRIDQAARLMFELDPESRGGEFLNLPPNLIAASGADCVRPSQPNDMGAAQAANRLAQQAARQ
jgi:hypothetical protein